MDSEDDVNDAVESTDDEDYGDDGGGDEDYGDDGGSDDSDLVFYNESAESNDGSQEKKSYIVLNEEDIRQHQENEVNTVSTVLSVSRLDASILLRHYHWRASNVHEAWFADEERVRKAVGLLEIRPVVGFPDAKKDELICGICFEDSPLDHQFSSAASCGHRFCNLCWSAYMSTSINGGLGCLMLRCPEPSCGAAVGQDLINLLASEEDKAKYARYLVRSYVEDNRKTKWCPAPGCDYAVEFVVGSENYDVFCLCSAAGFCWNCQEEAHRPMDCGTVAKWMTKNTSESENTNWIQANSKPCPNCKRPIEKNQGCMHMTCSPPCRFQFCWLCLGAWSDHGSQTGGFSSCNRYEAAKQDREFDETERRREMAKRSIQRYTHYYERWASNHSSRQKAIADLQSLPESLPKFITEAWVQIVECRRVLKWTYAYGYYLPEPEEHAKRRLFEYLQGEAEAGLERLHRCAEEDVQAYLAAPPEPPETDLSDFRTKLDRLTEVTRNYFENLVRALENGLSDVDDSQPGEN